MTDRRTGWSLTVIRIGPIHPVSLDYDARYRQGARWEVGTFRRRAMARTLPRAIWRWIKMEFRSR